MKVDSYIQSKVYEYQKNIPSTTQTNYIAANLSKVKGINTNQNNIEAAVKQTLKELQPQKLNANSNYGKSYNEILTRITKELVKKNDNKEVKKIPVESFKVAENNKNSELNQTQLNSKLKNVDVNMNLFTTPQITTQRYNQVDLLV